MEKSYRGVRYQSVGEVPISPWFVQGTVYSDADQARFAAAKLYASCNNKGVIVKRHKFGWTLLWWR